MDIVVTGAGGMIGGHIIRKLVEDGHAVRGLDIKPLAQWWQTPAGAELLPRWDIADIHLARKAFLGADRVFHLACPMGGIGWISSQRADCSKSARNTTTALEAATDCSVDRFLLTSSACVYRADKQDDALATALREEDAWPADPEPGYGLSKLYEEELCKYFAADYGIEVRVPRLHNVYGTHCSWNDGKEKAPAALCRKVAEAVVADERRISIWGDGNQTRSFCWMADAIDGLCRIMDSDHSEPLNLGSHELVTINQLVDVIEAIAGVTLERVHDLSAPQGVRGRNSDNDKIQSVLGWQPPTSLRDGLEELYPWIYDQVAAAVPHQRSLAL